MNEHGELATINVHLVDEHNQLRSEAEILAAVRDNLAAHIGMVEARIAVLEEHEENDPRPADCETGQSGPATDGGDVIMGDDIPGEIQN